MNIPYSVGLWGSVGNGVQAWNWVGTAGLVVQGAILILIVMAGVGIVRRWMNSSIRRDSEE
jgi:hypothetical protein